MRTTNNTSGFKTITSIFNKNSEKLGEPGEPNTSSGNESSYGATFEEADQPYPTFIDFSDKQLAEDAIKAAYPECFQQPEETDFDKLQVQVAIKSQLSIQLPELFAALEELSAKMIAAQADKSSNVSTFSAAPNDISRFEEEVHELIKPFTSSQLIFA